MSNPEKSPAREMAEDLETYLRTCCSEKSAEEKIKLIEDTLISFGQERFEAGLEKAAVVADLRSHDSDWADVHNDKDYGGDERAKEIAVAIRALKQSKEKP